MTLIDPSIRVCDVIEAQCRKVMARRAGTKARWDTREQRAEDWAEIECLLDQWLEVVADDGRTPAPHA